MIWNRVCRERVPNLPPGKDRLVGVSCRFNVVGFSAPSLAVWSCEKCDIPHVPSVRIVPILELSRGNNQTSTLVVRQLDD